MKKQFRIVSVLILLASLSGCATYFERVAQNKCFDKDWAAIGFDAAKQGRLSQPAWNKHNLECEKVNVWSSQTDFTDGYSAGVEAFCTERNGFEFGVRDRDYHPICAADEQRSFNAAFKDGGKLYRARANVNACESTLYDAEALIENAIDERAYLADEIASGELDKKTKKKYVKKRYRLKKEMQSAESSLSRYHNELRDAEVKEASISQRLHNHYYADETDFESGYSVDQTINSESQVVVESAVLLYRPEKLDKATRRAFKDKINAVLSHVTTNHSRDFRFQAIGGSEISFVTNNGVKTTLQPGIKFRQSPMLIFWDTEQLSFQAIYPDEEPPLADLDAFIGSQYAATNSQAELPRVFSSQSKLEQLPHRTEAQKCRKANHEPGSIEAVECIGPLLVQ